MTHIKHEASGRARSEQSTEMGRQRHHRWHLKIVKQDACQDRLDLSGPQRRFHNDDLSRASVEHEFELEDLPESFLEDKLDLVDCVFCPTCLSLPEPEWRRVLREGRAEMEDTSRCCFAAEAVLDEFGAYIEHNAVFVAVEGIALASNIVRRWT